MTTVQINGELISVTDKEFKLLNAIATSQYMDGRAGNDMIAHSVWTFDVVSVFENAISAGGVVSSAQKKNFVCAIPASKNNDGATISFTSLGHAAWNAVCERLIAQEAPQSVADAPEALATSLDAPESVESTQEAPESVADAEEVGEAEALREVFADNGEFSTANVDRKMIAFLAEYGPCKVGIIRDAWLLECPALASMKLKTVKGIMRRSINRMIADGRITKNGMELSIAK